MHTILEDVMLRFEIDPPKPVIEHGTCRQDQLIGRVAPDQLIQDALDVIALGEKGEGPMHA